MLRDEIDPVQALEIAIRCVADSQILYRVLLGKLANKTLRYQYQALLEEEQRQERLFRTVVSRLGGEQRDLQLPPVPSAIGTRWPPRTSGAASALTSGG